MRFSSYEKEIWEKDLERMQEKGEEMERMVRDEEKQGQKKKS